MTEPHTSDILYGKSVFIATKESSRLEKVGDLYCFYIDVGDLGPSEAIEYINRVKESFLKKPVSEETFAASKADIFCDKSAPWNPEPKRSKPFITAMENTCGLIAGHSGDHEWYKPTYPNCKICAPGHTISSNDLTISLVYRLISSLEISITTKVIPNSACEEHQVLTLTDGRVGEGSTVDQAFAQLFPPES